MPVTPFVGVLIENLLTFFLTYDIICHSLRGSVDWKLTMITTKIVGLCHSLRGSVDWKVHVDYVYCDLLVTPFVGVLIEKQTLKKLINGFILKSLPSWECWLKKINVFFYFATILSLPSWECWLKMSSEQLTLDVNTVTPFVGVLIENAHIKIFFTENKVTPFVGVLIEKSHLISGESRPRSHSLRGSVDWNNAVRECLSIAGVSLPSWECWLKLWHRYKSKCSLGHSLRGSVDWNLLYNYRCSLYTKSLPSWECWLKW